MLKGYRDWKAGMGRNGRSTGQTGGTMTDIGKVCPETRVVGRSKHMARFRRNQQAGDPRRKEKLKTAPRPGLGGVGGHCCYPREGL